MPIEGEGSQIRFRSTRLSDVTCFRKDGENPYNKGSYSANTDKDSGR